MIVIGADKGLCGALNSNLLRVAAQFDPQSTVFITAGRRAAQFVARSGRQLAAEFTYGDPPRFPEARAIATCARELFLNKEVDQVQVVATRYVNTLTQQAVALEFLPVGEITGLPTEWIPVGRSGQQSTSYPDCSSSQTPRLCWAISFRATSTSTSTRSC